jgi:hypothetical protein
MSHCHIHKGFCHIATFIEGDGTLNLVDFLGMVGHCSLWFTMVFDCGWKGLMA